MNAIPYICGGGCIVGLALFLLTIWALCRAAARGDRR